MRSKRSSARAGLAATLLTGMALKCGNPMTEPLVNGPPDSGLPDAAAYCSFPARQITCEGGPVIFKVGKDEAILAENRLIKFHEIGYDSGDTPIARIRILNENCDFMLGIEVQEGLYGETSLLSGGMLRFYVRRLAENGSGSEWADLQFQKECDRVCEQSSEVSQTLSKGVPFLFKSGSGASISLESLNPALFIARFLIQDGDQSWALHIRSRDFQTADLWSEKLKVIVRSLDFNRQTAEITIRSSACSVP